MLLFVSVPLRGITFLNNTMINIKEMSRVSVPLRGITFLNKQTVIILTAYLSFRPLTGNYISQLKESVDDENEIIVSVPLRGITFLNQRYF